VHPAAVAAAAGAGVRTTASVSQETATSAAQKLIAERFLRAAKGRVVTAPNRGAELRVPPGVMRRDGFARISRLGRNRFEVHIAAPWRGRVTVLLPSSARLPFLVNRVPGAWRIQEGRLVGDRVLGE